MFDWYKKEKQKEKMDYIAEIRMLADEGLRIDPKCHISGSIYHRWRFGETVNMQQIREFERDMNVKLPEMFVRYLTELGNGGAGPDYGIYSLDEMRKRNLFIAERADLPVMLDHSLSDKQWTDFAYKYKILEDKIFGMEEEDDRVEKEYDDMIPQMISGGIIIGTLGCSMYSLLMCRGAARGEIFTVDFDYVDQLRSEPTCHGKFEDWIIRKMKKSLEEKIEQES